MFSKWQGKVQNEHAVLTWLLIPHSYCSFLYLICKLNFSFKQPLGILYHVPLDLPSSIFLSTITSASCGLASVVTCSSLGFISSHMMCFSFTVMFRLVFVVSGSITDLAHARPELCHWPIQPRPSPVFPSCEEASHTILEPILMASS